jgi:AcrR family transcriptional regulator
MGETKAARTRRRILDAAARELVTHGYSGASLRRIAAGAGLQPGSLYFHFQTKEELTLAVLHEGIAFALAQVKAAIAALGPDAPARDRVEAAIAAHIRSLHAAGECGAAVARSTDTLPPALRRRYAQDARRYTGLWNDLLATAQRSGEIDAELDLRALRDLIFSAMNGTLGQRDRSPRQLERSARTLARLLLRHP